MRHALDESDLSPDPRVRGTIDGFLQARMEKYAQQFDFETGDRVYKTWSADAWSRTDRGQGELEESEDTADPSLAKLRCPMTGQVDTTLTKLRCPLTGQVAERKVSELQIRNGSPDSENSTPAKLTKPTTFLSATLKVIKVARSLFHRK